MTTYILNKSRINEFYEFVLKHVSCTNEAKMRMAIFGLTEIELEDAKKQAKVGDCLIFEYDGKMLPFQIIHKYANGNCVMSSYYALETHMYDMNTNVWKDSEIRRYMNNDVANKFDRELLSIIKCHDVHTDDYVTKDKFWLLSHEEIGYEDRENMFKKNVGTITFDYYKETNTHI